jgi:cytochrome c oxidase cbb3-type subunit 3
MAAKGERDAVTGVETTGHEWDGIKELNNPLPRWWVYTFYVCIAFAVVWWILFPAWPWSSGHTTGLLGHNQRLDFERRYAAARAEQAQWTDRIATLDAAAVLADPELVQFAIAGGEQSFKTNCAPCHGLGGAGQGFFPTLADDDWIWGGNLEQIEYTIRHGIRNGDDPEARDNAMPAFGADGLLDKGQIADVTQYLLAFTQRQSDAEAAERGAAIYAENCAACHGDAGEGIADMGAPALNDMIWLYGGEPEQIAAQIHRPRLGAMPAWQGRLDDTSIRMLTVYVHSLGGGE